MKQVAKRKQQFSDLRRAAALRGCAAQPADYIGGRAHLRQGVKPKRGTLFPLRQDKRAEQAAEVSEKLLYLATEVDIGSVRSFRDLCRRMCTAIDNTDKEAFTWQHL